MIDSIERLREDEKKWEEMQKYQKRGENGGNKKEHKEGSEYGTLKKRSE